MIKLGEYDLPVKDRAAVLALLMRTGNNPTLEAIWSEVDRAWRETGCSADVYDAERYAAFYQHPVWLLNGVFIEQDDLSLQHRRAITAHVVNSGAQRVVDFGGGFGTLARMLAQRSATVSIEICDPYPPQHGVTSCHAFPNIAFVPPLSSDR